jgi:hypothetical protein
MNEYKICSTRNDMPKGYVSKAYKWAHTEQEAVRLLLQKMPDKNGTVVFKRGGTGTILSVTQQQ